jgi:CheY-like chemotaxis protein
MYAQLSEELETTNRGVVALYAELDEKSQRLQATTEARSRFLNNVSHELRSPVTSIVGLSHLLLEPDGAPALEAEQRHQVELVARTGGELLALVNQLLDLARAEFGRLEPESDRVDIAELVGHVVDALRPLARDGVEVSAGPGNRIVALTDATLLRQVLRNLVANALAFTREGAVEVRTTRDPGASITIDVVDSGIGIDPANLERVFEEFFQVRGPHQADRKGSGLGLAYSRRVTELLGGTLSVVSEPGRGSTFTVRLPDRVAAEATGDRSPAPRLTRVLVADDDASFRATLRTMLHGLADEIVEAADGHQALNRLAEVRFDVVILDLMMPNLDGHGVLAAMADEPGLRDVPVVVVTSLDAARADAPRAAAVLGKRQLTAAALLACIVGLGLEERGR